MSTAVAVRRAFLCGFDADSNRNYEHRKQWVVDRIRLLSSLFAIDICAYAVMSNHYHIVLKLCPEQSNAWSDNDVIDRWASLCRGPLIVQKYLTGKSLTPAERDTLKDLVNVYRKRLSDLGWFMKFINEYIARAANREDNCTGHFWEARYQSKALSDEETLLTCITYVDLNPIRAGMEDSPETSEHTSTYERVNTEFDPMHAVTEQISLGHLQHFSVPLKPLQPFQPAKSNDATALPYEFEDYLKLVDWTGRAIAPDKRGHIDCTLPPILQRISIQQNEWLNRGVNFQRWLRKRRIKQSSQRLISNS